MDGPNLYSSHPLKFLPYHALYICDGRSLLRNQLMFNIVDIKDSGVVWPDISSKWRASLSNFDLASRIEMWLEMLLEVGTPKIWFTTSSEHASRFNVQQPHQMKVFTGKYQNVHKSDIGKVSHASTSTCVEVPVIMLIEEPPHPTLMMAYSNFYLELNVDDSGNLRMITSCSTPSKLLPSKHLHQSKEHSSHHPPKTKFMEFVANFLEHLKFTYLRIGMKINKYSGQPTVVTNGIHSEFSSYGSDKADDSCVKVESEEDLGVDFIPLEMQSALDKGTPKPIVMDSIRGQPFAKGDSFEPLLLECLVCDQTFKGGLKMLPLLWKHMKQKHPNDYANVEAKLKNEKF